ncbi:MAG: glycosyltransferase family 2 protein, partial [Planctomycetes bacterium]|nr:glycosyltransferase family 2 protein [Planctomycetota bacterium]
LEDCLSAIAAQTLPPERVILVDNASIDGSIAFVRLRFPEVEILALADNGGPSPARNAGLEAATTPWVFQVDNDAILTPDCLERLVAASEPGVACVQPRSVFDGERDRIHYDGARFHYAGMMTLRHFYRPLAEAESEEVDVDGAISVALLLDRELVLAAGGYDPAHFILFEDHDLSMRLRLAGHRIRHVPAAIVHHREGTEGISFRKEGDYSRRRVRFHARNRWIVLLKNHGWRSLLLGGPGIFAYEFAYFVFAVKSGALGAWFGGKVDLIRLLPGILKDRRRVQATRRVRDRDLLGAASLTVSPLIKAGKALRWLDAFLAGWWRLVRRWT